MTVAIFNQGVRCAEDDGRSSREFIQWLRTIVDQSNASAGLAAILDDLAALSVVGNPTNAAADASAITAGTDGHVLRRSGTALGFGTLAIGAFADAIITFAKLQNFDALSVLGRSANSAGVGDEIAAGTDGHILRRSGTTLGFGKALTNFITGTATNDNATAGDIGEVIESIVASTAVGSWTGGAAQNITSISLTAGDWDVEGLLTWVNGATPVAASQFYAHITSVSAGIGSADNGYRTADIETLGASSQIAQPLSIRRFSLAATTTVYLVGMAGSVSATLTAGGRLTARRAR